MDMNDVSVVKVADPAARSRVYRLFADAFRYPTAESLERFRSGEYLNELLGAMSGLLHACLASGEVQSAREGVEDEIAPLEFSDLETRYIMTFDVGTPTPPCPPYEGTYREGIPRSKRLLAIVAFYRHFGLKMSEEENSRELPDHICAELEFMHFLAFKEAQARADGDQELVIGYVHAQRDFLARHLSRWLPKFAVRLEGAAQCVAFAVIARLASDFVDKDLGLVRDYLKAWGILDEPEACEPEHASLPPIVPAEGGCCPPPPDF